MAIGLDELEEVVEVINAQVKLHPVDLTAELSFWFIFGSAQAGVGLLDTIGAPILTSI